MVVIKMDGKASISEVAQAAFNDAIKMNVGGFGSKGMNANQIKSIANDLMEEYSTNGFDVGKVVDMAITKYGVLPDVIAVIIDDNSYMDLVTGLREAHLFENVTSGSEDFVRYRKRHPSE